MAWRIGNARLAQLLTFAGVIFTAVAGLVTVTIQGEQSRRRAQCEIARDLLQDDTPSPYLSIRGRQRLVAAGLRGIERCLKEE